MSRIQRDFNQACKILEAIREAAEKYNVVIVTSVQAPRSGFGNLYLPDHPDVLFVDYTDHLPKGGT